jgi:hypothetical protein
MKRALVAALAQAEGFRPRRGGEAERQFRPFPTRGGTDRDRRTHPAGLRAFLGSLFMTWQADPEVKFLAGKFTAPCFIGHADFPGMRGRDLAAAVEFAERLGAGTAWTFREDPRLGKHANRAAVFFQDTRLLTETACTRPRFGDAGLARAKVFADLGWSRTRSASDAGTPVHDRAVPGMVTLAASL